MAKVLVTDGDHRAALAVVRSLGRAGHTVEVAASSAGSLAAVSRFAGCRHAAPDPLSEPFRFAEVISRIAQHSAVDYVLPITEASILALHGASDSLPVLAPPPLAFERIRDKELVLAVAAEAGIAVPDQVVLGGPADTPDLRQFRFPLVVKPARSVSGEASSRVKSSVFYADDAHDLQERLAALPSEVYPVLLQERIVGPGEGVFLLVWNGRVVAQFAHRRIREKPPSGGVSVCCESVPLDAELLSRCERLLAQFGWSGVAMVEFKRSSADGRPYLMEINGRFWGSLQLAIDAGVDFPRLLLEAAQGLQPEPVTSYRIGIREHWEWGEVDHYLTRMRREGVRNALPVLAEAVRSVGAGLRRRERPEVFRFRDPRPFLSESRAWVRDILRHG